MDSTSTHTAGGGAWRLAAHKAGEASLALTVGSFEEALSEQERLGPLGYSVLVSRDIPPQNERNRPPRTH